jgi:hypothetical protein
MTDQANPNIPPVFETWAIVELFGHSRIAGRVTEQVIAGHGFIRVDVPDLPAGGHYQAVPGFSKLYGAAAIYSITPVTQDYAMAAAQSMRVEPVNIYIAVPQLPGRNRNSDECDEEDDDEGRPEF